ncbi:hypothetical protein PR003_g10284 [Phytophthora rubi]|uniref:HTH CENPB-type domain-containing protein n=1 Tax=Phytophthora rubi TaxID=129364 RepID=A0A6A3MFI1_9STRA|nr:hypothetical protein PR001_g11996 [Phytophthora rubi]KAE9028279.1 hypothetical protein PR002_g10438 [Phytophthora rubi]KAE9340838.1 hypothetical protein PR003_g10284 [Phytophthora rubi]
MGSSIAIVARSLVSLMQPSAICTTGLSVAGYAPCRSRHHSEEATEISLLVARTSVGDGWYSRFVGRYPQLSTRSAYALLPKRNCVTGDGMFIGTLAKLVIELQLDGSRIFNMDETAFRTRKKSKIVVAVRSSTNAWCLDPAVNF